MWTHLIRLGQHTFEVTADCQAAALRMLRQQYDPNYEQKCFVLNQRYASGRRRGADMGRRPIGFFPMTPAERKQRQREKARQQQVADNAAEAARLAIAELGG